MKGGAKPGRESFGSDGGPQAERPERDGAHLQVLALPCLARALPACKALRLSVVDGRGERVVERKGNERAPLGKNRFFCVVFSLFLLLHHRSADPPSSPISSCLFFFQAEDGIRDFCLSRGLGDVYKRQTLRTIGTRTHADRPTTDRQADRRQTSSPETQGR